ncbi:CoA-binding protein [Mangrovibacterium sp.]|uniref:CoA-binding protein n=1 Tax=Mangrovibacterium sp. TaxID=1961364 RepID=UPI00356B2A71
MKKTLVIGASTNPERYSYKAITALRQKGHEVVALATKAGKVGDVSFVTNTQPLEGIDTVTMYIGPRHQDSYMDYIEQLKPKRVIFNPGTENDAFIKRLENNGIQPEIACTLVLLSIGQY